MPGIKNSLKTPEANDILALVCGIEFLLRITIHFAYSNIQFSGISRIPIQKVKCKVIGVLDKSIFGL
jgi:hypothetical protein